MRPSFALLVYVSAWLKHYYPAAFAAALLNSQPMGFYAPAQLVGDARDHGVDVRRVDVNCQRLGLHAGTHAGSDTRHETRDTKKTLRVSCLVSPVLVSRFRADSPSRLSHGRRAAGGRGTCDCRGPGRRTIPLHIRSRPRARLGRSVLEILADANAFGSLALDRRAALWQSLGQDRGKPDAPLFAGIDDDEPAVDLPPLAPFDQVIADYHATGLSLEGHPMAFCRDQLDQMKVFPAEQLTELTHGRRVGVAASCWCGSGRARPRASRLSRWRMKLAWPTWWSANRPGSDITPSPAAARRGSPAASRTERRGHQRPGSAARRPIHGPGRFHTKSRDFR